MQKTAARTPKLRHHKASGQGYVVLDGRHLYLGRFDLPETKERFHRTLAEWLAHGRQLPPRPEDLTIAELIAFFWKHVEQHYRRADGTPTDEQATFRQALRPVKQLYGSTNAVDFGPRALKTIRQWMVDRGWCRRTINHQIGRVRRMFKWAVENELAPATTLHALQAVSGLRAGRSAARESDAVRPAPEEYVNAVQPHVSPQVWAMVRLQCYTACRPGEVVKMRPIDLDTTGKVWLYSPLDHKTAHHGHKRTIYLGPRAQSVVAPFLIDRPTDAYIFSPRDARNDKATEARMHRRKNQEPTRRKTNRIVEERYTVASYRRAVHRACTAAGVPQWSPLQLRHNAATFVRKEFGLESAQVMLGHRHAAVTEIYAETNRDKGIEIAAKIG